VNTSPDEAEQARFERFIQKRDESPDNDSGRGPESHLPEELRGLNWGGLLMNFIWGLAMRVPYTWLCLVPFLGFVFPVVMWVRGNEWAWKFRRWDSVEHFRRVQEKWAVVGLVLVVVLGILTVALTAWVDRMLKQLTAGYWIPV